MKRLLIIGLILGLVAPAFADVTVSDLPSKTVDGSENVMIFDSSDVAYRATVDALASATALSGPGSSIDNGIVLWDGTDGLTLQDSAVGFYYNATANSFGIGNSIFSAHLDTGLNNIIFGNNAGDSLTGADRDIIIGDSAGAAITTASDSVIIGDAAGALITTGSQNFLIGTRAGDKITTGYSNVVIGHEAGDELADGAENIYIGDNAGNSSTVGATNTATNNVAIGVLAGTAFESANYNVCIGDNSCSSGFEDGAENVIVGEWSGNATGAGASYNTCVGGYNCRQMTGNYNVGIGYEALVGIMASSNVGIGYQACQDVTGSGNVCIGNQAGEGQIGISNKLFIDNTDTGSPLIYGDFSTNALTINGTHTTTGVTYMDGIFFDHANYDQTDPGAHTTGHMYFNTDDGTLDIMTDVSGVTLQVGQEVVIRVRNSEDDTLSNGEVVYMSGSTSGDVPDVKRAQNDGTHAESEALGLVTADISSGGVGFVTCMGKVRGLDTATAEGSTWNVGDLLYVDDTLGALTKTAPSAPNHTVPVGMVVKDHATDGIIFVSKPDHGLELDEVHDVNISGVADGEVLTYDSGTSTWTNEAVDSGDVYGEMYVPYGSSTTIADSGTGGTTYTTVDWGTNGISDATTTPDVTTDDDITTTTAGIYRVNVAMSFSGTNSSTWICRLYKNGSSGATNLEFVRKLGTGGDVGSASFSGLVTSDTSDTWEVKCTTAVGDDNKTMTLQAGNFSMNLVK